MDVEAEIAKLKQKVFDQYEKDVRDIKDVFERQNEDNLQRLEDKKNALIKQLDDRLVLVRQFPSVLDADAVVCTEQVIYRGNSGCIEVDGRSVTELRSDKDTKWKILVMAKKIG